MNSLHIVLIIFVFVREAVFYDFELKKDDPTAPLALIMKQNYSITELAIPQKATNPEMYAEYFCYGIPEEGLKIACPADDSNSSNIALEKKWQQSSNLSIFSRLLILWDYVSSEISCKSKLQPMIKKSDKKVGFGQAEYCGRSKAEVYGVGFPVTNQGGTKTQTTLAFEYNIKLIPVYKICHSTAKDVGTLYTVHRIESPTLLLQEVWEHYRRPNIADTYISSIDESSYSTEQLTDTKQYPYQFVGKEDMPTKVWKSTTDFLFNYASIVGNEDLINGMLKVDNYIRLYSRETNEYFTVYSGVYQKTVNKGKKKPSVSEFWRIIINDNGFAISIVTTSTKTECGIRDYICYDRGVLVKQYKNGGCTYICPVTEELIEQLGLPDNEAMQRLELPQLKITGLLELKFPKKIPIDSEFSGDKQKMTDEKIPEEISIFDFFKDVTFKNALESADPNLAQTVIVH